VEDEATAIVVAVDRPDEAAAIAMMAGIEEAAVSREAHPVQASARIDEGNTRDLVRNYTGEEAASGTGLDGQRRGQELARRATSGACSAMLCPEQTDVVPLKPDEVDRGMATEACSGRNPSCCDGGSVPAGEALQERRLHRVSCSGRALECPELSGRRLAGCRCARNTPGGGEGCESEAPHSLSSFPEHRGKHDPSMRIRRL
jgi:hypothetical protein